jgi:hypothetical protein
LLALSNATYFLLFPVFLIFSQFLKFSPETKNNPGLKDQAGVPSQAMDSEKEDMRWLLVRLSHPKCSLIPKIPEGTVFKKTIACPEHLWYITSVSNFYLLEALLCSLVTPTASHSMHFPWVSWDLLWRAALSFS